MASKKPLDKLSDLKGYFVISAPKLCNTSQRIFSWELLTPLPACKEGVCCCKSARPLGVHCTGHGGTMLYCCTHSGDPGAEPVPIVSTGPGVDIRTDHTLTTCGYWG